ncbi:MAG TPA: UDP-2,3-diacylglucosamine diphosphatase [Rudaea sp.]|jgi:UDP-2,3-diacylglucosamine hydrolase|nr:UDP-2,3-diacylglucosamine diphosphatase [Rudaea sp.]
MATLFISDLHLDEARPHLVDAFEDLLAGEARAVQALYILGDLFESYIGDDDDAPLNARVARATRKVRAAGVPVYFMHGNRDFLLGEDYAARAGMTLLPDPTVVELGGEPTLLMHGDTLCTDDAAYLQFRKLVRDPVWQRAFLAKPLAERRAFAAQARGESRKHTANAKPEIMDVNQAAVEAAMRQHAVRRLIHGHTHRPATHRFDMGGNKAERIVLGDWYEQASSLALP